jgi:hypothetical protein
MPALAVYGLYQSTQLWTAGYKKTAAVTAALSLTGLRAPIVNPAIRDFIQVESAAARQEAVNQAALATRAAIRTRVEASLAESAAARASSKFDDPVNGLPTREWPPFPGTIDQVETDTVLAPGTLVDRFGPPRGSFLSPFGTSYGARALKPGTMRDTYYVYEVLRPLPVKDGVVRPWFGEAGEGEQYRLDTIDGVRRSPSVLTTGELPYLKEIYRGKYWDYPGH